MYTYTANSSVMDSLLQVPLCTLYGTIRAPLNLATESLMKQEQLPASAVSEVHPRGTMSDLMSLLPTMARTIMPVQDSHRGNTELERL